MQFGDCGIGLWGRKANGAAFFFHELGHVHRFWAELVACGADRTGHEIFRAIVVVGVQVVACEDNVSITEWQHDDDIEISGAHIHVKKRHNPSLAYQAHEQPWQLGC